MSSHVTSPGQSLSQYKVGGNPTFRLLLRALINFILSGELLVSHTVSFTDEESSTNPQDSRHSQASSSLTPSQPSYLQVETAS